MSDNHFSTIFIVKRGDLSVYFTQIPSPGNVCGSLLPPCALCRIRKSFSGTVKDLPRSFPCSVPASGRPVREQRRSKSCRIDEWRSARNERNVVLMKKRLLAFLLLGTLLVSLTSCAKDPGKSETSGGAAVELKWMPAYLKPDVVKKYVDLFNESQDKIRVYASEAAYGNVVDYTQALALNMATGADSYDLFSMSSADFNKYVSSGIAYCLDDYLLNNPDIKELALQCVTRDGHVYAYPATIDVMGLYVNLDMLEGSGHTLEDLGSWEDLLQVSADISKTYGNIGTLTNLTFGSGYAEFLWYSTLWGSGADIVAGGNGEVTVRNPDGVVRAAMAWRDLITGPGGSIDFNNDIDYFVNQLCGMLITGQTALAELDEYLQAGEAFNWTFIPLPPMEKGGQSYSALGGWFTVVNARNPHAKEAAEFLNWLFFETDYVADMCRAYYQMSPLVSADAKLEDLQSTKYALVTDALQSGKMVTRPEIPLDSTVLSQLGEMLSGIVYSTSTEEEARELVQTFIDSVGARTE